MKRKNMARNALFTSIISLLLCVSMLVGTTFAWFTDEVTSGMNTIAAGNLDVELLANGTAVNASTPLFDDVTLWEPGAVAYENLQVVNAGTLALKYQMTLNFGNENELNGHKLSEVLKVVILNKTIDASTMTRAQILAEAQAAAAANQGLGALSNFYKTGELEAGVADTAFAVVIYWAPNENSVDNLYNANNGKSTSDGEPLHIDFGVNLQATQKMSEEDSFGKDYDQLSSILPKATVNSTGPKAIKATYGIGGAADDIALDASFQFLPNETLDQAQASDYRYWHADFVVKANKDVPAESVALAGYYNEWCQYNNDNWVALVNDQAISANTEIRLVEMLGASVNYEEICRYGFDESIDFEKRGFLCGAVDLTGKNAGTTITVELRMYETEAPSEANNNSTNVETGNYKVIGVKTHTFGVFDVTSPEALQAAIESGLSEIKLGADLTVDGANMITVPTGADVTIDLNGHNISADFSAKTDAPSAVFTINKNASLTVNGNGDVHATAAPTNSYVSSIFTNLGSLVVNGGNYSMTYGTYDEGYLIPTIIDTNSNVGKATTTINGGTFTHTRNMFRNFAQPQRGANNATLIINGGTFNGQAEDYAAIWNQKTSGTGVEGDGIVTVNGGNFHYVEVTNDFATGVTIAAGVNLKVAE